MNSKPGEASELRVAANFCKALAVVPMAKAKWKDLTPIRAPGFHDLDRMRDAPHE
jgi:hypothetical protein